MEPFSQQSDNKKPSGLWHSFSRSVLGFIAKLAEKTDPSDRFMEDASPEHTEQVNFFAHLVLWGALAFFIVALIWAYFGMLDEVTHAQGKVIPASQVQIIQNLEGGIVKKMFVNDGDLVTPGQPLLQLDTTLYESNLDELQNKALSLQAKIARLSALTENKPFAPDTDLQNKASNLLENEHQLYLSQLTEIKEAQENYSDLKKEYDLTKPLIKGGAASEVEVLRLQRQLNELEERIANFESNILHELNDAKRDLLMTTSSMEQYQDRINRATVRSPLKGIVEQTKIRTIGGVAQPGMQLMEVVPLEDTLLVEGRVSPKDIGFLHVGQPTTVKITAYDYSIYGGLPGKIEEITANAIVDKELTSNNKGETYYLITVRTQKNYLLDKQKKPLYIIPGMVASVDVITGKKSVLDYLLKPILKAKEEALRER